MGFLGLGRGSGSWFLILCLALIFLPGRAHAFGAGNIPSIAQIEGFNFRHGDIEDFLSTVVFLKGKKWSSLNISRVYFGNWLRDYSQAIDTASLKGANAATVRILVWVLSFLAHGYATEEFEVTEERLGVYRPEEHTDNPLGYPDDGQTYDPRLRPPVREAEIEIDSRTGMKNYITNESGDWATSSGYIRFSLKRSIHYGRVYTSGSGNSSGREEDLCEALRCLGQALHTLEDFPAHSNYCELALRELGYHDVFPHCGVDSEIDLQGKRVYPLVTGTFGGVDFLHSVIGEVNDNLSQSELDELNAAVANAQSLTKVDSGSQSRGLFGPSSGGSSPGDFISLVSQLPGIGDGFAREAQALKASSDEQAQQNSRSLFGSSDNANVVPGMSADFDPVKTARRIYPILQFRDKIVKAINRFISKVPGLEKLLDHIGETLTAFVLGLLAPFIQPIVQQVSQILKEGSSTVIGASAKSQFIPWDDPTSTNPTHSMLSKDHFTNILNSCAGRIAVTILQYAVPRIVYAWENPGVPADEVIDDILRVYHHPAIRDESIEIQRTMFNTVQEWANNHPLRHELSHLLSSESVKDHKNHVLNQQTQRDRGMGGSHSCGGGMGGLGHGKTKNSLWNQIKTRDRSAMDGSDRGPLAPAVEPAAQEEYGYHREEDRSHEYRGEGGGESAGYYGSAPVAAPPSHSPQPGGWGQPSRPPPGQYGGPPPGSYGGPPPGQYGAPPSGHYGGHGGYGTPPQPQYGYGPPGGYQQQPPAHHQGYGAPSPGYHQPPPPSGGWGQYPGQYRY
ncbi:Het-C-domain-containing protein [Sodiomyces alkalinus F11]|uniref:Het-C-domain-containing protein n=1 Tax=Sodiomyces alkalinus (strain CBS 110278 / VKM F-3762 / F11) TaxID=1314773 RepID=A0A3N2Q953_SODAK|nr:Het-C-domain-containing protein [Sodiomyces alkalinus F11]ROT43311.1 Het-C-domain-containing protein [Sodiomyces alkalinus F11]